jgi:recombination protein RecA
MAKGKKEPIATGGDMQARIKVALAQTEKEFGIGTVTILGKDAKPVKLKRKDSGSHLLNQILGGGYPEGRIIEVYGPESSGKTTVALHAVAMAQRLDPEKLALYVDAEHALDVNYAKALGVDLERFLLAQPDTAEEALKLVELWMEQDCVSIYVVDSVAALIPRAELEGEIGDNHVGTLARLMSMTMKKLARLTNKTNTVGIFINQLREKVGVMFGNPETTPGGRALKFYSSIRLDVRPMALEKKDDNPYIRKTKIKAVKNKVHTPYLEAEVDIEFGKGISRSGEIIDIGQELGLITKSGAWHYYKDIIKAQGRENMKAELEAHPEIMDELNQLISIMMMPDDDVEVAPPELGDMPEEEVDNA